jgi:uncharacterized membrane protein
MPTRKSLDLPLIGILTVIAMVLVLLDVQQPVLRTLFTLPLAFYFPGYALVAALFPRQSLFVASRLLFALALSIALIGVGGLVLQVTQIGLFSEAWVILLGVVTLLGCLVALFRRAPSTTEQRQSLDLNVVHLLMFGAAAVLVMVAFNMAQEGARQQPRPGFTQLWMLPSEQGASEVTASQVTASQVMLGIRNDEGQALTYRLVIEVGGQNVGEWQSVPLAPGEVWETAALIPLTPGGDEPIEALLYRSDAPDAVYRSVILTASS